MTTQVDERVPIGDGLYLPIVTLVPAGEPPTDGWPAVVVLHEAMGIQPEILRAAQRFVERGWVAVIPDLFGTGNRARCLVATLREISQGKPGPLSRAVVTVGRHIGRRPDVAAGRRALVGFCLGGGLAMLAGAIEDSGIRAISVNYGEVPSTDTLASSPPTVASYGARDLVFGGKAAKLRRQLQSCGVPHDVKVYDDAGHSFMTDGHHPVLQMLMIPMRVGHVPDAAEDAWSRVFSWLDRYVR